MWYLCWVYGHYNKDHHVVTVIAQLLFSNTCDLFSRKLEVFSEMEMEINIINNKIFTKLYLNLRVRGKEIS